MSVRASPMRVTWSLRSAWRRMSAAISIAEDDPDDDVGDEQDVEQAHRPRAEEPRDRVRPWDLLRRRPTVAHRDSRRPSPRRPRGDGAVAATSDRGREPLHRRTPAADTRKDARRRGASPRPPVECLEVDHAPVCRTSLARSRSSSSLVACLAGAVAHAVSQSDTAYYDGFQDLERPRRRAQPGRRARRPGRRASARRRAPPTPATWTTTAHFTARRRRRRRPGRSLDARRRRDAGQPQAAQLAARLPPRPSRARS